MNKTQLIIISGIIIVAGLIGYTLFGTKGSVSKNAGETTPHDDTGLAPHTN